MVSTPAWLKSITNNPSAPTVLLALPHAGSGVSAYRDWAAALPTQVEFVCAELPGREARLHEPPLSCLPDVIEALRVSVTHVLEGRRLVLFGHSLGALLSFELARALRRSNGIEPACMFASGREAPTRREPGDDLHKLPDAEFIEAMVSRYDGIPKALLAEPEILEMYLPAMKADLCLTETYRFVKDAPFGCPIHILAGRADTRLTPDLLRPWADETTGPAPVVYFNGGHFFVRDSRPAVIRYVCDVLGAVAAGEHHDGTHGHSPGNAPGALRFSYIEPLSPGESS